MKAMRHIIKLFTLASLSVAAASCGDVARSGRAPVFLVIDSLQASSSAGGTASNVLLSDVVTRGSTFNDVGSATFSLAQKDVIASGSVGPSSNNNVTITRYHVTYRRADGRNTQGVDVPYAFDGAGTVTVPIAGRAVLSFELVRHVAKEEPPLVQLQANPQIISTIADVTFYGRDQVGNDISVTGSISIAFGNFGD